MKKIVLLTLALILTLSLTACGGNTAPNNTTAPTSDNSSTGSTTPPVSNNSDAATPTEPETPEAPEETTRPPASTELSTEWNSFQFELEGTLYTLPISYSELEADGWILENKKDMDETLEIGKYILNYKTLKYNNKEKTEITVQFANLGDKVMPLKDCYVSSIQFAENRWNENTVVYFPGGLTIGSTQDEVKALFGEPSNIRELSVTVEWTYQSQNYEDVTFTFTKETGKIEQMRMSNIYLP